MAATEKQQQQKQQQQQGALDHDSRIDENLFAAPARGDDVEHFVLALAGKYLVP
jgi:hypothetical protein